jgi:hypothetical protein
MARSDNPGTDEVDAGELPDHRYMMYDTSSLLRTFKPVQPDQGYLQNIDQFKLAINLAPPAAYALPIDGCHMNIAVYDRTAEPGHTAPWSLPWFGFRLVSTI